MNITEFAAYAGVSKAAVSRYFNGGYLSEEKRARIEAAAAATGYRPSLQAQMLRTRRTRQVLVILPKLSSESCARMVEGISAILEESGYQLLLVNTANDSSKEIAALHLLQQNTVDGVILIATIFTPEHRTILSSLRLPVVILGQEYPGFCSVSHDDRGEVLVLSSSDKRRWRHINTITTPEPFGYMWECPDLFQLDGQWFLLVSPQGIPCQNVYGCGFFALHGDFRWECTLGDYHPLDGGFDYYAPQSFADGERRLQFGWMGMPDAPYHNPTVEHGWQHCLTFPRQLCRKGKLLVQAPADELKALRGAPAALADGAEMTVSPCFELEAATGGSFALTVAGGLTFACDEAGSTASLWFAGEALGAGRDRRTMELQTPCRSVRVLADASSLEIFVNGGEAVFTTRYYPEPGPVTLHLEGAAGTVWPLAL